MVTLNVVSFAIEFALDPVLPKRMVTPVTLGYTTLCVMLGGYITARIARGNRMRVVMIMGAIQAALVIPAMLTNDAAGVARPVWIATMLLIPPAAWCGGRIQRALHSGDDARSVRPHAAGVEACRSAS